MAKGDLILIPEYASWYVPRGDTLSELLFGLPFFAPLRRLWEEPPMSLDDDQFADIYDDLEFIDPDGACSPGVRELALKKRAEVEAQRRAAAAAAAAPAGGPASKSA